MIELFVQLLRRGPPHRSVSLALRLTRWLPLFATWLLPVCATWLLPVCAAWLLPAMAAAETFENMRFERLLSGDSTTSAAGIGALKDIVQDRDGFIWLATENGLARYDGHDFRYYYTDRGDPSSISSDFVSVLFIDHIGKLWLGTAAGVNIYDSQLDRFDLWQPEDTQVPALAGQVVTGIAEDGQHNLYIATGSGLSVINGARTRVEHFFHEPDNPTSLSANNLRTVFVDRRDRVWLGTTSGGLNLFDLRSRRFTRWLYDPNDPVGLGYDDVERIVEDYLGNIWIATHGGGLSRLNPDGETFTNYRHRDDDPYSLGDNVLRDIYEDRQHNLWLATDHGGLALYDRAGDRFVHFRHSPSDPSSLSSDQVRVIYEDPKGNLWVGNFPGGVNFYDRGKARIGNLLHQPDNPNSLSHNAILAIFKDRDGIFWIGTEFGLNAWDPRTGQVRRFLRDPADPHSLRSNAVTSVTEDAQGNLWVGTWSGGLHRYERGTGHFTNYSVDVNDPNSLASEYVWQLAVDRQNQLWIGTTEGEGLSKLDLATGAMQRYSHQPGRRNSLTYNHIWAVTVDRQNKVWLGTLDGLNHLDPATGVFTHYFPKPENPAAISSNNITALLESRDGRLWIGTDDGQLNIFDQTQARFAKLGRAQGLPGARISSLVEDQDGFIWTGTSNGLARIHPATHEVRLLQKSDGLAGNNHNRNAAFVDGDGTLYFGSTNGISIFHPRKLILDSTPPKVVITELRIANEIITPGDHPELLQQAIETTRELHLNHHHNMFSLKFSALSFTSSYRHQYAYKLEGFDEDWHQLQDSRIATYTNLDPGDYVFRVRAANSSGAWNPEGSSLRIRITPPPWRSAYAYAIYTLLIGLGLFFLVHLKSKRLELKQERTLNSQLKNLDRLKDAFLANTSHELRTPLNGIIGLAESILDGATGDVNAATGRNLEMIVSSGKRLSNLINDILDHSKLADNRLELNPKPVALPRLVDQVFSLLQPLAEEKHIDLVNQLPRATPLVLADENRLQQILINLVGNAIKYSPAGTVAARCRVTGDFLEIAVADEGTGIAPEHLQDIFTAFKQLDHSDNRAHGGTGLGLAITRQLVEMHGGRIWAESAPGAGAEFKFTLRFAEREGGEPETAAPAPPAPAPRAPPRPVAAAAYQPERRTQVALEPPAGAQDVTILIVDDDAINRMVLSSILALHHYRILEARDGFEALELLQNHPEIHLVLLDVMMPKLSGYETCQRIREHFPLDRLPVLFLTAKRLEDELLQSFNAGGNDLLTKPVEKNLVLAKIKTYLQLYRARAETPLPPMEASSAKRK